MKPDIYTVTTAEENEALRARLLFWRTGFFCLLIIVGILTFMQ